MTLGTETAALLTHIINAMNHQLSAGHHAILTDDDRRSVLANIKATIEVAAKLAEVAHVDALTAHNAAAKPAEVANMNATAARTAAERTASSDEKERVAAETMARLQVETEKAGREAARALERVEELSVQVRQLNVECGLA
ncbi:hypothetical protein DFP73DRAFT_588815 [Morchella snyderi]|nr:hypothetical protein DFP73DRAFT_588815 [Morchella snyderi]